MRSRARIAAAANLFYALGALSSRGVVLPRALPGVLDAPDPSMLLLASSACHLLAEEMERFVVRLADGSRPPPGELARLVDRVEECWNHVTNDGDAGLVR